jgi:hypothetical protein
MSLRNRLILPVILSSLAVLAGCGGTSNPVVTPPPSGSFSNSNLSGTYVFTIIGSVSDATSDFVAITGTFSANGSGSITGGTLDANSSALSAPIINDTVTGGTYLVTADGRGQATLTTATQIFSGSLKVDFVLSSSAHGLITEFDTNGSGSGSLDLQTSTSQPAGGNYVLGLTGISGVSVTTGSGTAAASAGVVTLDGSGNATGSMDYNNNSTPSLLTINSGSSVLSGTPGTATLVTGSGTLNFDVYPIDATHMKVIETDGFPILAGDLLKQSSSQFPSGQIVFTMGGADYLSSVPLVVGGIMTSDGTTTISAGSEDYNDGGVADTTPLAFSGTIAANGSRYLISVSNFENGANGTLGTFTFAAYPSDGGIQLIEVDGSGVTSGVGFTQTSTALASGEGYGFDLTAVNMGSTEDDIAEFTTTTSSLSGIIDVNDQGATSFKQQLTGTYTPDSPPTGAGVLSTNAFGGVYYTVDGSNALFIELDSSQLGVGALQSQNASAKSNLAAAHLATVRSSLARARARRAWRSK